MSRPNAISISNAAGLSSSGRERKYLSRLRNVARTVCVAWCAFGIALTILLPLELILERIQRRPPLHHPEALAPAFEKPAHDFLVKFADEMGQTSNTFETTGLVWQPFVYWRGRPFPGDYITINNRGLRATWNPPDSDVVSTKRPRVFFLGGSAMWGHGNRNDYTIPSLVTKELHRRGLDVGSTNYAQGGYVTTQEVITLFQELQRGNAPDVVVFLDGYNDICSSEVNEAASLSILERERLLEFRSLRDPAIQQFERAIRSMAIGRALNSEKGFAVPRPARKFPSKEAMSQATMRVYIANVKFVEALKKAFHFEALYCWQPVLYEKNDLSVHEQEALTGFDKMQEACSLTWKAARDLSARSRQPGITDAPKLCYLADLFNESQWRGQTAFVDRCHLTEKANEAVARRITDEVEPLVRAAVKPDRDKS